MFTCIQCGTSYRYNDEELCSAIHQDSCDSTMAAAKKLAIELASDNGTDYVVMKPYAVYGPSKPRIIETKCSVK